MTSPPTEEHDAEEKNCAGNIVFHTASVSAAGRREKIHTLAKRILNTYGYCLDLQREAVKTVLRRAGLLRAERVGA